MKPSRGVISFACFLIGSLLMLFVDAAVARIVGVPSIFAGIFLGIAAIATPEFLSGDRDNG